MAAPSLQWSTSKPRPSRRSANFVDGFGTVEVKGTSKPESRALVGDLIRQRFSTQNASSLEYLGPLLLFGNGGKMGKFTLVLTAAAVCVMFFSCGSSNSTSQLSSTTLQSITISQQPSIDFPQLIATGTYGNGKQVTPLAVSWVNTGLPVMTTAQPPYSLTSSPFLPQCINTTVGIAAIAPANPKAPSSGSVPLKVWQNLVFGTAKNEGGFVGATAQASCP